MGFTKIKNLCSAKDNVKKMRRKATDWEKIFVIDKPNICQQSNRQGINLQNIQTAHAAQYQKNKQTNQKMGGRSK